MSSTPEKVLVVSYRSEIGRKLIHFASALTPLIYFFIDRTLTLSLLIPIAAAFIVIDVLRQTHSGLGALYDRILGHMMRGDETGRLCGASHVMIASVLCVTLFPKPIAITAMLIMSISDGVASLVGLRSNGPRWGGKSLAGSAAFLVSAVVMGLLFLPGRPVAALVGALAGTVIEALPLRVANLRVDDNITVPLGAGLVMWALCAWYYSGAG
jgi:dolichol kinase